MKDEPNGSVLGGVADEEAAVGDRRDKGRGEGFGKTVAVPVAREPLKGKKRKRRKRRHTAVIITRHHQREIARL